jgi:hypothetical protein
MDFVYKCLRSVLIPLFILAFIRRSFINLLSKELFCNCSYFKYFPGGLKRMVSFTLRLIYSCGTAAVSIAFLWEETPCILVDVFGRSS